MNTVCLIMDSSHYSARIGPVLIAAIGGKVSVAMTHL